MQVQIIHLKCIPKVSCYNWFVAISSAAAETPVKRMNFNASCRPLQTEMLLMDAAFEATYDH
jgi:hypothetical protein